MIVALAGRRIDAEDTDSARFPVNHIEKVKEELYQFFIEEKPDCLVCSGACGADLIALEVAGKLNIARKMMLPFAADLFRSTSVTDRKGNWGILFDSIYNELNEGSSVIILNFTKKDKDAYEKTNLAILKKADALFEELKAKENQQHILSSSQKKVAVIIWEGIPKNSNDTTDHFRQHAIKGGYSTKEINSLH